MSENDSPLYVILTVDQADQAQVEKINDLTRELAQALESAPDAVASIEYKQKSDLPQGTKAIEQLYFAEQLVLALTPLVVPWVLKKIDVIVKAFSMRGERVSAKVMAGNSEVKITPQTSSYDLQRSAQQVKAVRELAPAKRYALIVGNSQYQDERLATLNSSIVDAERFAEILADPAVGSFDQVKTLINKNNEEVKQEIETFFSNRNREDLLLFYYSGHGIKSPGGQLFLTSQNTSSSLLRSTGVSASFIKENMGDSASQRQILILDCCYGGAILEGTKSDAFIGQHVDSVMSFQPSGFGKIIITASEAMQYAFDGQHIEGQSQNSAFTKYLIDGLRSGDADTDHDGLVDIDELYQYIYRKVVPQQTPNMSSTAQEGRMFIGLNPNPPLQSASLPDHIQQAMQSDTRLHRQGAVSELARLLRSEDPSVVLSAETGLRKMLGDDSKSVSDLAQEVLEQHQKKAIPVPAQPKSVDTPLPPPAVQTPFSVPASAAVPRQNQKSYQGETLVGLVNALIPGYAYVRANRWGPAILTFVVAGFLMITMISLTTVTAGAAFICTLPLIILQEVYLFIQGRNVARKHSL